MVSFRNCVGLCLLESSLHADVSLVVEFAILLLPLVFVDHVLRLVHQIILCIRILLQEEYVLVDIISRTFALILCHLLLDFQLMQFTLQICNAIALLLNVVLFSLKNALE